MIIDWKITEEDIENVTNIVSKHKNNPFVVNRYSRNIDKMNIDITTESMWRSLMQSILTTQEKSGPGSAVLALITEKPFPLDLTIINSQQDKELYIHKTLKNHGLHYHNSKTDWILYNYNLMSSEFSNTLINNLENIANSDSLEVEREMAHIVSNMFKGIGPKQSRNFLQMQGLTKYVLPIDSRLTTWFNEMKIFPFTIDAGSLSSLNFYEFIEDAIQELCKKASIYPCILDASIFVSFNKSDYDIQFN